MQFLQGLFDPGNPRVVLCVIGVFCVSVALLGLYKRGGVEPIGLLLAMPFILVTLVGVKNGVMTLDNGERYLVAALMMFGLAILYGLKTLQWQLQRQLSPTVTWLLVWGFTVACFASVDFTARSFANFGRKFPTGFAVLYTSLLVVVCLAALCLFVTLLPHRTPPPTMRTSPRALRRQYNMPAAGTVPRPAQQRRWREVMSLAFGWFAGYIPTDSPEEDEDKKDTGHKE